MQSIDELLLAEIPVHDPDFMADPLPHFRAAKQQHSWLAKSDVGYLVHEYEAMNELYFMAEELHFPADTIVTYMGAQNSPWGVFTQELMINKQGEEHKRIRDCVARAFTPRSMNQVRPTMRNTVSKLLDEWAPKGAFDFAEFAANFPIRVMCEVIGASPDVVPKIREYLEVQGLSFSMDPEVLPASDLAITALMDFVDKLVIERKEAQQTVFPKTVDKKPENGADVTGLLDELIAANTSGQLSDYELRNLMVFLFAAGYDTSKNMLTLIMHVMLTRPEEWRRCAEDVSYCTRVMEETLRFHSVSNVPRTVVKGFSYRDVFFPVGTSLQFILTLSGRDGGTFDNPDQFLPERADAHRHLAFGRGRHICLGQYLARAQIEEGLHLIAQRLKNPRLAGEVTWRPFIGVWGIKTLPIIFDPA